MNKTLKTAAVSTLGTGSYVSPEAKVTEILSEGVLCASGDHEPWNEKDLF